MVSTVDSISRLTQIDLIDGARQQASRRASGGGRRPFCTVVQCHLVPRHEGAIGFGQDAFVVLPRALVPLQRYAPAARRMT
jgi:hypothetical protein